MACPLHTLLLRNDSRYNPKFSTSQNTLFGSLMSLLVGFRAHTACRNCRQTQGQTIPFSLQMDFPNHHDVLLMLMRTSTSLATATIARFARSHTRVGAQHCLQLCLQHWQCNSLITLPIKAAWLTGWYHLYGDASFKVWDPFLFRRWFRWTISTIMNNTTWGISRQFTPGVPSLLPLWVISNHSAHSMTGMDMLDILRPRVTSMSDM